ncbi:2-hydroxyacid dehydrogenase [Inmirania thermothiophila]|uniref:Glycerate dehydrogenase n=1 Tax=Inmirania thermothiophila TaxID=1750597 RepID=A0A3N1Y659_9GAMM|nr:2-hydroxyacid dehydrogenase [Inmirania thermothiophila]ROR34294.1 glycerate dehydrogenase [Inmirania thermothiophila]
MRGVFLDRESLDPGDLDLSALEATLPEWRMFEATAPQEVPERIAGAAVVITNKVVLDAAAIEGADALRLILVAATGTNNVDLEAARRRGIPVANVRAYGTPSVVEHVFALVLTLMRSLDDYRRAVREGRWAQARQFCLLDFPVRELAGRRMGIVGLGELGRGVARVAEAFGMEVLVAQRPGGAPQPGRLPLERLLPEVDVLSIHCPLTEETRGLIGERELRAMRPDAILVNTARGGIVDEEALARALREGWIGGAAVDVLTREPPREGNPLLAPDIPNLILTPHVAWASRESRQRLVDQMTGILRAFLEAGRVENRVA